MSLIWIISDSIWNDKKLFIYIEHSLMVLFSIEIIPKPENGGVIEIFYSIKNDGK